MGYNIERYKQREYICDLDDLVQYAIRTRDRIKWELSTTSDASYVFPYLRQRKVNRLELLDRAIPRLQKYFNNKLKTLNYE